MKKLLFGCFLGLLLVGHIWAADQQERIATLRKIAVRGVNSFDKKMEEAVPKEEIRHLTCAALTHLALGDDNAKAEKYLKMALDKQNMDEKSPSYGDVPWNYDNDAIHDPNGIEFAMSFVGPILLRYGDKLSPETKEYVIEHARAGIVAIRRHKVDVAYTNIYLMKIANLLLLGQGVGDESAVTEGKANLDAWLEFTRTNGVGEYDSPTYSFTQLSEITDAYINAPDEATRSKLKQGLDYMWTDLSVNFFPGRQFLSGSRSRSYDFIWERGTLQHEYYLEGLADELMGTEYLGGVWLEAVMPNDYHPSKEIVDLSKIPVRVIEQRFGPDPGKDRYNYITPDFSVGCSSHYYGPQDLQIGVELASSKDLPVICVVPDPLDAPFGTVQAQDKSGHIKPHHIKDVIAAVQDKGTILALLDLSPDLGKGTYQSLATDITIPMQADGVYLDDKKVNGDVKQFETALKIGSIVYVREGKSAVAMRIFAADGCDGQEPSYWLKYEGVQKSDKGKDFDAARLVAYHYRGAEKKLSKAPVRAGVFIQAATCADDSAFADFVKNSASVNIIQSEENGIWSAKVNVNGTELAAGLDLSKGEIAFRRRNDQDISPAVLSVNGKDLASNCFSSGPPVTPPLQVQK